MLAPTGYDNKENDGDEVSSVGTDRTIVASNVNRVSLSPGEKTALRSAASGDLDFLLRQIPHQRDQSMFVHFILTGMERYARDYKTLSPSTIGLWFRSFAPEYDGGQADIEHHINQITLHLNNRATRGETMSLLRAKDLELATNANAAAQEQPRPANAEENPANAEEGPPLMVAVPEENGSHGSSSLGSSSAGRRARENQDANARPPSPRAPTNAQQPHAAPDARQPRAGIVVRAFPAVGERLNNLAGSEEHSSSELCGGSSVGLHVSKSTSTE